MTSNDAEHIVEVFPRDLERLREWIKRPNGAIIVNEMLALEAVAHGGVLVRTSPFQTRRSPIHAAVLVGKRKMEGQSMDEKTLVVKSLNLKDVEAAAVRQALLECEGNKSKTALLLGVDRRTLYRYMAQHRLGPYEIIDAEQSPDVVEDVQAAV